MNRIRENKTNIETINKAIKNNPTGIKETELMAIESIFYILQDISISLAVIADKMEGKNGSI
jgi:hypothetical protein